MPRWGVLPAVLEAWKWIILLIAVIWVLFLLIVGLGFLMRMTMVSTILLFMALWIVAILAIELSWIIRGFLKRR